MHFCKIFEIFCIILTKAEYLIKIGIDYCLLK